jgi:hypothetical protein
VARLLEPVDLPEWLRPVAHQTVPGAQKQTERFSVATSFFRARVRWFRVPLGRGWGLVRELGLGRLWLEEH